MKTIAIEGQLRKVTRKSETNALRKSGNVLCSIYGGTENIIFSAPAPAFKELVYTPEFYTATISVNGKQVSAVMQDLQFDPITDEIQHIDFLELTDNKKVIVDLPVKLEGVPPGIKDGGKIHHRMKKLKVRLLPKDLVEHITVKIDHLELGKSVRIFEMKMEGLEFLNALHIPIVSVLIPRQVKEEVPAATAVVTAATPAAPGATPAAPGAGTAAVPPPAEKGTEKKGEKKKEEKKK